MSLPLADFNLILVAIKFSSLFGSISSNNLGLIIVTLDRVSTYIVISLFFYLPFNKDSFISLLYIPSYKNFGERSLFLKTKIILHTEFFDILDPLIPDNLFLFRLLIVYSEAHPLWPSTSAPYIRFIV